MFKQSQGEFNILQNTWGSGGGIGPTGPTGPTGSTGPTGPTGTLVTAVIVNAPVTVDTTRHLRITFPNTPTPTLVALVNII
jgi:hypothetical protein